MRHLIIKELKEHAPFTGLGAVSGIILMFFFRRLSLDLAYNLFYTLHPIHVLLSALVTAAMYQKHKCGKARKCSIWLLLVIGYLGSIGVATLSDSLIPYLGEVMLDMPHRHVHLGFIEKPVLVNGMALVGIIIAYFNPMTKFPHYGHVFLSTWASLFHLLMAGAAALAWGSYAAVFIFLFISVWIPCCISDIVFPLLFVKEDRAEISSTG